MKRFATVMAIGFGFVLASAASADAQLINFPTNAAPTGAPRTYVAASLGRGLNDNSGKQTAFGAFAGRTGIANRVTVSAGVGIINSDPDSQTTFGGTVGVALTGADATTGISVQGGLGYMSPADDVSLLNIPIGIAVRRTVASDSGNLALWVMPRINMMRSKVLSVSDTQSEFGASGGVAFTTTGGVGFHASIDLLASDPSQMVGGAGIHYVIN